MLKMVPSHNVLEVELLSPLTVSAERAHQLQEKGNSSPASCPASRGNVECHRNMLRKMQMSFGGEWNPAALSMGIWKPVTLEYYTVAILRDVDVAINHNDTHWTMDCRAFISTSDSESFYAEMIVYARWVEKSPISFIILFFHPFLSQLLDEPFVVPQHPMNYRSTNMEFQIHVPKDRVRLWWPNGYGEQKLYAVTFNLKSYRSVEGPNLSSRTDSQKQLNIGFRTIELVEDKDGGWNKINNLYILSYLQCSLQIAVVPSTFVWTIIPYSWRAPTMCRLPPCLSSQQMQMRVS